jgi:hypothetical protein
MAFVFAAGGLAEGVVTFIRGFYCFLFALALAGEDGVIFFYCLSETAVYHFAVDLEFDMLELGH